MSEGLALGDAGACPVVEWEGARYTLGHPTQKAKTLYQNEIVEAERRGLDAQLARKWVTPAKYDEKLDDLGRAVERGDHLPGGPLWAKYAVGAETPAGVVTFLWSLFAQHHPALTVADVRRMAEGSPGLVRLAVRRVVPGFFEWVGEALNLPPDARAALTRQVADRLAAVYPDPTPPTGTTP